MRARKRSPAEQVQRVGKAVKCTVAEEPLLAEAGRNTAAAERNRGPLALTQRRRCGINDTPSREGDVVWSGSYLP